MKHTKTIYFSLTFLAVELSQRIFRFIPGIIVRNGWDTPRGWTSRPDSPASNLDHNAPQIPIANSLPIIAPRPITALLPITVNPIPAAFADIEALFGQQARRRRDPMYDEWLAHVEVNQPYVSTGNQLWIESDTISEAANDLTMVLGQMVNGGSGELATKTAHRFESSLQAMHHHKVQKYIEVGPVFGEHVGKKSSN
ncbi:hypothetical protein C8J56DRAFT_1068529 [Mycena floridula]|nr:hypothetical protein C8J56DRAFT_1068529 [Mycena floridula]